MAAAECNFEAATACDLHRVLESLGEILEQCCHFLGRLQILFFAIAPRAPRVGENPALLNTDPCFVRFEIVTLEKSDVVAGDERKPHRERQLVRRLETRRIASAAGPLDAKVESSWKDGRPGIGPALRLSGSPVQQRLTDIAAGAGRDGDNPACALTHPGAGSDGKPGAALGHVTTGQQPGELPIPRIIHRKQCQQTGRGVVRFWFDRQIDADDRLDAPRDRGAIETHHAEQVRTVGDGDRGHAQRLGSFDERADPQYSVDERELGVKMQMDEAWTHGRPFPGAHRTSIDFTGAKLRRWIGEGPSRSRASRCARVP